MHFTAQKSDLARALALCNAIVEKRQTIPVLANVLLARSDNELVITATDMDMELGVSIPASFLKGEHEPVTLPAHTLGDIVKKASGDHISIATKADKATITSGKSTYRLGMLDAAEFPAFERITGADEFTISTGDLGAMLVNCGYAMSSEDARYYLRGIHFTTHDVPGNLLLRAVATDGHRLGLMDAPSIDATLDTLPPIILPAKACDAILKIIKEAPAPSITASFTKTTAEFTFPNIVLKTKLVDGTFPDFIRIIPGNNSKCARIQSEILAAAVARVGVMADKGSRAVKLSFSDKDLTVSTRSPEGSAEETLDVPEWTGGDFAIGFNGIYLLEVLALMPGEVELLTETPEAPAILYPLQDGHRDPARLNIIMPLRV